jgi:hypothetical protein
MGDVEVQGKLTRKNEQGGQAVIPRGGREVHVKFSEPFAETPLVTATIQDGFADFGVFNVSREGFTIRLVNLAAEELKFAWTAVELSQVPTARGEVASQENLPLSEEGVAEEDKTPEQEKILSSASEPTSPQEEEGKEGEGYGAGEEDEKQGGEGEKEGINSGPKTSPVSKEESDSDTSSDKVEIVGVNDESARGDSPDSNVGSEDEIGGEVEQSAQITAVDNSSDL